MARRTIAEVNGCNSPMACELKRADLVFLHEYIATRFPGFGARLLANQGWCSSTFLLDPPHPLNDNQAAPKFVLQFRQNKFAINCVIAHEGRKIYGSTVPIVQELPPICVPGLEPGSHHTIFRSYRMSLIPGVQYSSIAPQAAQLTELQFKQQLTLVGDFASFIAQGWTKSSPNHPPPACSGKVGSKIPQKLQRAAQLLPSVSLKAAASHTFSELDRLSSLPVSLNHGDLIPSNIIVNPDSWKLSGVVDWAEAEYLPFGTCLYGLEHFLGFLVWDEKSQRWRFTFYDRAHELRCHFWHQLCVQLPILCDPAHSRALTVAKEVGTVLWYGFAWDDGAIDRVVNDRDDPVEVAYLTAFLCGVQSDWDCIAVAGHLPSGSLGD